MVLQWGRNLFVAESSPRLRLFISNHPASMGPQLVRCGKLEAGTHLGNENMLQWGRNLFVAERRGRPHRQADGGIASMGPQLVRCGKSSSAYTASMQSSQLQWGRNLFVAESPSRGRSRGTLRRFNGAATCSLRKVFERQHDAGAVHVLQWGRNLFVAESRIPRQDGKGGGAASMGPQLVRCGKVRSCVPLPLRTSSLQWGRNLFVAERIITKEAGDARRMASMGPQLVRCGKRRATESNGEENSLQWGRNLFVAESERLSEVFVEALESFNGAATCSLRKAATALVFIAAGLAASMGPQLVRCGKGLLGMLAVCDLVASMGPQLVRCGKLPLRSLEGSSTRRFNGAATCSLRKAGVAISDIDAGHDSFNGAATCSLRKERSAVRCSMVHGTGFNGAATCSLRKADADRQVPREIPPASMGPQLVRCGKQTGYGIHYGIDWLQWGRNLFVAESPASTSTPPKGTSLQWGRNLFVAESSIRVPRLFGLFRSFNGAATCSLRKGVLRPADYPCFLLRFNGAATCSLRKVWSLYEFVSLSISFNGAATCSLRKVMSRRHIRYGGRACFNGAATCSLRKGPAPRGATAAPVCFNGAATCSLRKVCSVSCLLTVYLWLQWGRNLFVAESTAYAQDIVVGIPASMGPQLVRCGKLRRFCRDSRSMVSFNGAATCSLRKACQHKAKRQRIYASMGPQLVRCGKPPPQKTSMPSWTSFNGAATCSLRKAMILPNGIMDLHIASMGPQLVRCGKTDLNVNARVSIPLQWGRNLFVAESL